MWKEDFRCLNYIFLLVAWLFAGEEFGLSPSSFVNQNYHAFGKHVNGFGLCC